MPEQTDPEAPQPFDPTTLDDAALAAEFARVAERGRELASMTEHTAEQAAEFGVLADLLPVLNAETAARIERATAAQAQRDAFSNIEVPVIPTVTPGAAPEAPVAAEQPAPVVQVPSVSQMGVQAPQVVPAEQQTRTGWTGRLVPHTSGLLQRGVGQEFSGLNEISETLIRSAQSVGRNSGGRFGIAQFDRSRGEELTISEREHGNSVMRKIRQARSEYNLEGGSLAKAFQKSVEQTGSLTAAAGWCAPSQNDYDLCTNWSAGVGILDLPTVTAPRGGINYTDEPDFPTIYANAVAAGGGSNLLTEAQVIADTAKTCSEIPCPVFEDRRLDVAALCIRASFLQAAGYPEVVNAWIDGLMASHEQEINRNIIAQILTRAGAATVFAHPDPDPAGGPGDSFTSSIYAAIELAREDLMYRFMLPRNSTIEVVFPYWVLAQMRADLSRRTGVNLLNVSDAELSSGFTLRGARVQFVRGWQDGLITGGALNAAFPGGDAATPFMTALPSTVDFLAWPAGSVVLARQDVVTLTNVYDAASLAQNEYTALFTEEGYAPLFPCPGQRLYTVAGCVGGITGAASINCLDEA